MHGCLIAAVAPFDLAFDALTNGSPLARALSLPVIGIVGFAAARQVGLSFRVKDLRHPVGTPMLVAAVVAAGVAIVDGFLFRRFLRRTTCRSFRLSG
jgi:hypothetical protein